MRRIRIFTPQPLAADSRVWLSGGAAHHVTKVLRLSPGEKVTLFNGEGCDYFGLIHQLGAGEVEVRLLSVSPPEPQPAFRIHLLPCLIRSEPMDFLIQKAVELGVQRITPLFCRHSLIRFENGRLARRIEHWRALTVSACEQSGRRRLVELETPLALKQVFTTPPQGTLISLDPEASATLASLEAPQGDIHLLIGPEGGMAEEEKEQISLAGFLPVRLGPRTLRAETAPLAAIAAMQMLWGDFRD